MEFQTTQDKVLHTLKLSEVHDYFLTFHPFATNLITLQRGVNFSVMTPVPSRISRTGSLCFAFFLVTH